jgi:hypothetical protein
MRGMAGWDYWVFEKIDELQEFLKAIEFSKSKFLATGNQWLCQSL